MEPHISNARANTEQIDCSRKSPPSNHDSDGTPLPDDGDNHHARPVLNKGIGRRLLVMILLFSSFITLILTAGQLYIDFRRDVSDIEQRLVEVEQSYVGAMTASLWNLDKELLRRQLEGIVRLPHMHSAMVLETVKGVQSPLEIITTSNNTSSSHLVREFPLIHQGRNINQQIGVLRIEATLSEVYQRLMDKAQVILVSQGIKTFVVSFFILFIVYLLITRHLVEMSRFLAGVDLSKDPKLLSLDRTIKDERDELDQMVHSINTMQTSLQVAYEQLRQANVDLEDRVTKRTKSLQHQIQEREAAEKELIKSRQRLRDIAEAATDWFWEMDSDLVFTLVSERLEKMADIKKETILSKSLKDLGKSGVLTISNDGGDDYQQILERHQPFNGIEAKLIGNNNTVYHIQIIGKPMFDENGVFAGYRGAASDITARKTADEEIRRSRDELEIRVKERTAEILKLSQAVEQSPVSVLITDTQANIEYVNQSYIATTGTKIDEVIGKKPLYLDSNGSQDVVHKNIWATIDSGQEWSGELLSCKSDGSNLWLQVHISPVKSEAGAVTHFLIIEQDISIRKEQEQLILHQAQYDSLTDLPNRILAMDRLNQAIKIANREASKVALLFIDLDDFKKVNDTLGHEVGDRLLIEAAKRLNSAIREGDTVARHGGDEFLVIVSGLQSEVDAEPVADKILNAFASPFSVDGVDLVITPSIGLSVFPNDGSDATLLLKNADAAMYRAKDEGRNRYRFFTSSMNEEALLRLKIEHHLRSALDNNELTVFYQPIVNCFSRKIEGVEALLRWENQSLGHIGPDRFIPIAEQAGIIVPIGHWVMQTACAQVQKWNERLGLDLTLSVNVSPRQFRDNQLLATVETGLAKGLNPSALHIEVTEGLLIQNHHKTLALLNSLKELGVRLSMDDFGTGYSSLSYLKTLPFDIMKVDRSFIRDIADDHDDLILVAAAIAMAKSLGLEVVGEGVETEEQYRILLDKGCDYIQGYLFSKPLAAGEFEVLLQQE